MRWMLRRQTEGAVTKLYMQAKVVKDNYMYKKIMDWVWVCVEQFW